MTYLSLPFCSTRNRGASKEDLMALVFYLLNKSAMNSLLASISAGESWNKDYSAAVT